MGKTGEGRGHFLWLMRNSWLGYPCLYLCDCIYTTLYIYITHGCVCVCLSCWCLEMCVTVDDIIQSETDDIHYDAFERSQRQQQRKKSVHMEIFCKLQC